MKKRKTASRKRLPRDEEYSIILQVSTALVGPIRGKSRSVKFSDVLKPGRRGRRYTPSDYILSLLDRDADASRPPAGKARRKRAQVD